MKYIPNIITLTRIGAAFVLLFLPPMSFPFMLFYLLGGLSDILDGVAARNLKAQSNFGALLDSVADAILIGVLLVIFVPLLHWPQWVVVWILLIVAIRMFSLLVGFLKFRKLAFLHTYANKVTGFLLFCFPVFYALFGLTSAQKTLPASWGPVITAIMAAVLCAAASLSAIEELAINIKSKELSRNIASIFQLKFTQK